MRRTIQLLNQNCRLAARLISDAQDRQLDKTERVGLTIHLMGCRNCRRYRQQVLQIENLLKTADENDTSVPSLSEPAKVRIAERLRES